MTPWILLFGLWGGAQAAPVLVQGPGTSTLDYRAALKARGDQISPTQSYLRAHPAVEMRAELLARFADAQAAFLQSSNTQAQTKFKNVLELLLSEDWAASDREIFLLVYFRLAQMETDVGARDRWLKTSLRFGTEVKFDSALIPPPLVIRRNEIAAGLPKIQLGRAAVDAGWSAVLINGERCDLGACPSRPLVDEPVRVTYLSDQWAFQTQVSEMGKVASPRRVSWVEGKCTDTHWSEPAQVFRERQAFWALDCPGLTSLEKLKPQTQTASTEMLRSFGTRKKETPLYQNKWVWAGVAVGAIAIYAIVRANEKHASASSTETTPTTSLGN